MTAVRNSESSVANRFVFAGEPVSPFQVEGLRVAIRGARGIRIRWRMARGELVPQDRTIEVSGGVNAGGHQLFNVDLAHNGSFLLDSALPRALEPSAGKGLRGFDVELVKASPGGEVVWVEVIQRQLLLDLPRRLKGATVEPGQEAKVLTAPPLPDSNEHGTPKTMHIVLMAPAYPMRIDVEPGAPVRFEPYVWAWIDALCEHTRVDRFYYYFTTMGDGLGSRTDVDWFQVKPVGQ